MVPGRTGDRDQRATAVAAERQLCTGDSRSDPGVVAELSSTPMAAGPGWQSAAIVLAVALAMAGLCRCLSDYPPLRDVEGHTAPGYKRAAETLRLLLLSGEETGAAFAAIHDGQVVVDLWGGYADLDAWRPWRKESLSRTFATTAWLPGAGILLLSDRGLLDLDRPASSYWPEFATGGKQNVTVGQLLRREVTLVPLDRPLRLSQLTYLSGRGTEGGPTVSKSAGRRLPAAAAAAEVGALLSNLRLVNSSNGGSVFDSWPSQQQQRRQYELLELVLDQLVRRVDPNGRGVAEFVRDEIIGPSGLNCHAGLPADSLSSAARLLPLPRGRHWGWLALAVDLLLAPGELLQRTLTGAVGADSRLTTLDLASLSRLNDFDVQKVPLFSLNGFATVRSLARLHELLLHPPTKGSVLSPVATTSLLSPLRVVPSSSLSPWYRWAISTPNFTVAGGLQLLQRYDLGAADASSGNEVYVGTGDGGQHVLVDPERRLVLAYVTSRMGVFSSDLDPRFRTMVKAVYGCLPGR